MAKNSCVTRVVNSINKSRITSVDKQELININYYKLFLYNF